MSASPTYNCTPGIDEALVTGSQNVAVAGVAVQLALTVVRILEIVIQAKRTNTGRIYIGGATVSNNDTQGVFINAGESLSLSITDLSKVWLDASVGGEGVTYTATLE